MPTSPPTPLRSWLGSALLALSAAAVVAVVPLASEATARPIAHRTTKSAKPRKPAKPAKSCSTGKGVATAATARRTAARSMARYTAEIARLRRTGAAAHRGAIRRDQARIALLRRQLACLSRFAAPNASGAPGSSNRNSSADTGALRIGLNADTQGWGNQMASRQDLVAPSGAKWLREQFNWNVIEPASGQYDWSRYDQLELTSAQRGFTVLPLLFSAPSWAGSTPNTIPADPSAYADFVAHVVARYGPGGAFWAAHPELASHAPQYFELWNEPYYPQFSAGRIDPGRYAQLVKAAGQAGKAANPQAKFIAAAETDVQPTGSSGWVSWTDAMYAAVPDLNNYFDAVAVHPYSKNFAPDAPINGNVHDKFQRIATIHDHFSAHNAGQKPLWITEDGWSTCADRSQGCVSEAEQAAYTNTLFAMVKGQYQSFVGAVFLYHANDLGPPASSNPEDDYGLTRADGSPKPAWAVLRAATGA